MISSRASQARRGEVVFNYVKIALKNFRAKLNPHLGHSILTATQKYLISFQEIDLKRLLQIAKLIFFQIKFTACNHHTKIRGNQVMCIYMFVLNSCMVSNTACMCHHSSQLKACKKIHVLVSQQLKYTHLLWIKLVHEQKN